MYSEESRITSYNVCYTKLLRQRAIREMNGYEATHKEINTALKCVEERGWSIARCKITRMPMLFRLVKA